MTDPARATVVPVALGSRAYEIVIGADLIAAAGAELARRFPGARYAVITDETVAEHHLDRFTAGLADADLGYSTIVVQPGESSKSFETLASVVDGVLSARLERGDLLIALGGGVIGDLVGFAAGIVRRGMRFVQVPTTLLAQVDSSVGGKTGINTRHGKNLVGLFHQPSLVLADTAALDTLSERHLRAGYAEVVKYGLIDDPAFFDWLEIHRGEIFAGGPARAEAVARACRAKAEVVRIDEKETGPRALLNLGHTFGHALETATDYDAERLVHGEGVAIGMVLAHEFSARLNLASPDDAVRAARHLAAAGLPTTLAEVPGGVGTVDGLMQAIFQDKKVKRGRLTFVLTRGIGKAFVADDVVPELVRDFLADKLVG
ncbi:3-dehydroquinate synthase [Siculibacillus lacustris]|uniref:3-dehydroquinate synthase n=1 Tax=Siculibacillus lacustris TaxID=1549641 RepID=A0A4Q9VWZ3_9HYPH|nr:3-dehydroquinate synthase [Siculibacillus lacustris]TBW40421.1 3-dehydroquinate synthase [Siculibacillus lacustris]